MLQDNAIDVSENSDINKTRESKEFMLCHYWYFKDISFQFQPYLCNGLHTVSMMAYELKKIGIFNAKGVDYSYILWDINEALNSLNNLVLEIQGVL